jgi:hypothetical protein
VSAELRAVPDASGNLHVDGRIEGRTLVAGDASGHNRGRSGIRCRRGVSRRPGGGPFNLTKQ